MKSYPYFRIRTLVAGALLLALAVLLAAQTAVPDDRYRPSRVPDRIILTWSGDPASTQAVTWRTDASVHSAVAQIALADAHPDIESAARTIQARTTLLDVEDVGLTHRHSVGFTGLAPSTLYAYRVGDGEQWSEWFHFSTASREPEPFSFIYFGDAQNDIRSKWSRAIRAAYSDAPKASFMIHAGDLVNRANRDVEWGEWFEAGGWLNGMIPSIPAAGNHEYWNDERNGNARRLSTQWRPQFTLPDHGPEGLEETVYYIDYQGARIIVLNSMEAVGMGRAEDQARWLEGVLRDNPNRWTIVTFHHPVFSVARGRDNPALREHWQPLFERYGVDLVLQGHDHTYGRGTNLTQGTTVRDGEAGPMYVVSVSGPKMYRIDAGAEWMDRLAEDTQLYQIIHVEHDKLRFEARTVTGELYDGFELVKLENRRNRLVDQMAGTPERRQNLPAAAAPAASETP